MQKNKRYKRRLRRPKFNDGLDYIEYKIKPGDTLWDIADKNSSSPNNYKQIALYNDIADPSKIYAGQTIRIPKSFDSTAPIGGDIDLAIIDRVKNSVKFEVPLIGGYDDLIIPNEQPVQQTYNAGMLPGVTVTGRLRRPSRGNSIDQSAIDRVKSSVKFTAPQIGLDDFAIKPRLEDVPTILKPTEIIGKESNYVPMMNMPEDPGANYSAQQAKDDVAAFYGDFADRWMKNHPETSMKDIANAWNSVKVDKLKRSSGNAGVYRPYDKSISINSAVGFTPEQIRQEMIHELRHHMDESLGRPNKDEIRMLKDAYDLDANRSYKKKLKLERTAVNTKARGLFSERNGNVLDENLNNAILNASDEEVLKTAVEAAGGYGSKMEKYLNPKTKRQKRAAAKKAEAIRKAWINVAQNNTLNQPIMDLYYA